MAGSRKKSDKVMENLQKHNLRNRTPEERRAIAMMGVEARKKKKEQTMALQNCMKQLLAMPVKGDKGKRILREFGFQDTELTNRTILMVALFKKGLTGDVGAIREITEMIDKLEMAETGKNVSGQTVTINLLPTGNAYQQTEQDEQDIWKIENGIVDTEGEGEVWETEPTETEEDDWGSDTYDG